MYSHIPHLTVNTAHMRMAPKTEAHPQVIEMFSRWTHTTKIEVVPGEFEIALQCERDDVNGIAQLNIFSLAKSSLAKVFLAWNPEGDAMLWPKIIEEYREYSLGQVLRKPESAPWLAVVLLPASAALKPEKLALLGALEPCWAWAVLETVP